MYLGMRAANVLFSRAWLFHAAQRMGRIGARLLTRKDGWIHSLPSVGAQWSQTRDLRGLPKQTFHEWWKNREQRSEIRDQNDRQRSTSNAEAR
jgi:L-lactate dehydrogenase complex protein LldF